MSYFLQWSGLLLYKMLFHYYWLGGGDGEVQTYNSPFFLRKQVEQRNGFMGHFQLRTGKPPSGIADLKEKTGLKGANPASRSI